jgi:hypothetical protein
MLSPNWLDRLCDRVAPVLQGQHLIVEQRMREARHIAGHKDVVGDDPVPGEGAAPCVAGNPLWARGQPGVRQPLDVADRPHSDDAHVRIDAAAVGQVRTGEPAVPTQRSDRDPAAQVHAVGPLQASRKLR